MFKSIETECDYSNLLRQVSTSTILECIYEISRDVFVKGMSVESLTKHIKDYDPVSCRILNHRVIIQPWQFPDLAYYAIKFSNDYRGFEQLTQNAFYCILSQTNAFLELDSKRVVKQLENKRDIYLYLCGFSGEQFKYQRPSKVYYNMIRELYIVFELSKKCNSKIKPPEIIRIETGVEWERLVKLLFEIYLDSLLHNSVFDCFEQLDLGNDKEKEDLKRIINYYTATYDEIRKSNLGRQIFYAKPFVKTQKGKVLTVSVFFNSFMIEHAPLWIIRNYYQKLDKRDFTSEFGKWFEEYFREVSSYFKIKTTKIQENPEKQRSDWLLEIGKHTFLIEQKSSIVPLSVKQQSTDLETYKRTIETTIHKALRQLFTTEKDLKITEPIKILLFYDDYIDPNLLPYVFNEKCPVENDHRYFIANIIELEMLFSLSSSDEVLFEKVINEMLDRNKNDSNMGISIIDIMQQLGYSDNPYWLNPIFQKYKNLLYEAKNAHKLYKEYDNESVLL